MSRYDSSFLDLDAVFIITLIISIAMFGSNAFTAYAFSQQCVTTPEAKRDSISISSPKKKRKHLPKSSTNAGLNKKSKSGKRT